jgi:hypothetical protein
MALIRSNPSATLLGQRNRDKPYTKTEMQGYMHAEGASGNGDTGVATLAHPELKGHYIPIRRDGEISKILTKIHRTLPN